MRFCIAFILFGWMLSVHAQLQLNTLQLPPGFKIDLYAKVPNARQMALGPDGVVFVGTRRLGKVFAVIPNASKTKAKNVITLASGLNMPTAVAYYNGALYVAAVDKIFRYPNIIKNLTHPKAELVTDKLPKDTDHGWRYIKMGPDHWLYVSVGAPCNVCLRKDPRYATIMRIHTDGRHSQIYAKGIRNSVGFAFDPKDQTLWFTDNGRDWLGDNLPPDELNHAPKNGLNFGFPYYYGNNIPDPEYGKLKSPQGFTPATLNLDPHVAALGMIFYTGTLFPQNYRNQIFIAEHGSWNRGQKIGYRVMRVDLSHAKNPRYIPFIQGWLQDQEYWGRPVDLLQLPDGSVLVSDDYAGAIYRIAYAN